MGTYGQDFGDHFAFTQFFSQHPKEVLLPLEILRDHDYHIDISVVAIGFEAVAAEYFESVMFVTILFVAIF